MSSAPDPSLVDGKSAGASRLLRRTWPLVAGAAVGIGLRLIYSGKAGQPYGAMQTSFALLVPVVVGAVTVLIAERSARRSWTYYFWIPAAANAVFILGTFLMLVEGFICVILALPLFAVLGGLSGLVTGALCRWTRWSKPTVYGLAILPLILGGLEPATSLPTEVNVVQRQLVIQAPADRIWAVLMSAKDIEVGEFDGAWMYRIGVPAPVSADTEEETGQLTRHITMGKGIHFDQVAQSWERSRRVLWTYRFTQDSFPPGALDDHVRIGGEYFDVIDTEYTITPSVHASRLDVKMRYRISTNFNWYVRPLARFLTTDFGSAALKFYAHRAERDSSGTTGMTGDRYLRF